MAGSLLTLGSRADLMNGSMDFYNNSNMDLPRLGELSHSYDQLSDMGDNYRNSPQLGGAIKNTIGVGTTRTVAANKSILQRSKSDTLKAALFASSPTLDHNPNNSQWNSGNAPTLKPQMNSNNNNKSVTFSGLAANFQTLSPILMPGGNVTNNSQPNNINNNYPQLLMQQNKMQLNYYDSQINKDSAYGSTEFREFSPNNQITMNGRTQNGTAATPSGYANGQRMATYPMSTVRTQSSQQQRMTAPSMKDTAYDRYNPNNFKMGR